jgi:hypothetical protein
MYTTARTVTARSTSLRKDQLLYSRVFLTVDKASGSPTATSSFGEIVTNQKRDSGGFAKSLNQLFAKRFLAGRR